MGRRTMPTNPRGQLKVRSRPQPKSVKKFQLASKEEQATMLAQVIAERNQARQERADWETRARIAEMRLEDRGLEVE